MIVLDDGVKFGRLGNKLLQNVGISVLSQKYDLFPQYHDIPENNILKLNLFYGNKKYENFKIYTDFDLENLLNSDDEIDHGIIFDGYFQFKCLLLDKIDLINSIIPKIEITQKNKVFVHIRLGDVENINNGIDFYKNILNTISFNSGMISSDNLHHSIVRELSEEYNLDILDSSPIDTLLIASQFEHRILSGGTFSWWIGFLGNNSNVYCSREYKFHGDIFVYPEWKYFD